MENRQDAFFRVDSRLLLQLGEQLVSNKAIALAELVKNSYDADAKKATIIFEKVTSPGGTITIEDDGIGITEESFINCRVPQLMSVLLTEFLSAFDIFSVF